MISLKLSRLFIQRHAIRIISATSCTDAANKSNTFYSQGLFGNFLLQSPKGFKILSGAVQARTTQLLREIVLGLDTRATNPRLRTTVELIDDLSNEICSAADLTDCVRCMHPDPEYKQAAEESMRFYTYLVETLNTTPELYNTLKKSLQTEAHRIDPVSKRIAKLLLEDFELSGVLLKENERKTFVELSDEIFDAGTRFVIGCEHPIILNPEERFNSSLFDGIEELSGSWSHNSDYKIRQYTHNKYYAHRPEQEVLLKRLITARHRIAQLTDFPTYAHRAQNNSMLCTYKNVHQFLEHIIQEFKPLVEIELEQIKQLVSKYSKNFDSSIDRIGIPDIEFATMVRRQELIKNFGFNSFALSPKLNFESVLEGFEWLVGNLYGLTFRHLLPDDGECWPGNVIKLDVYRIDNQQFLGTIFLDFDARSTKLQGDCHFTIKCSKLLDNDEYQTPIVVVSLSLVPINVQDKMSFKSPWAVVEQAKISPQQAENLFHEMGHALHSILGRTKFQHVAGTRCPTDFAEIPSHLMECFFNDLKIFQRICCDKSGRLFSEEQAKAIIQSKHVFSAVHTVQQAIYSLFDLEMHGEHAKDIVFGQFNSTELFYKFNQRAFPNLKWSDDYAYQHRISHLVTYGAKYYSYLVARASASLIYDRLFLNDPTSRQNGQKWADVQSHGGEYASHILLAKALDNTTTPTPLDLTTVLFDHAIGNKEK